MNGRGNPFAQARRRPFAQARRRAVGVALVLALSAPFTAPVLAEAVAAAAEQAQPVDFAAEFALGQAALQAGSPEAAAEALEHFRRGLDSYRALVGAGAPDAWMFHRGMGLALLALGRVEQARDARALEVEGLSAARPGSFDLAHALIGLASLDNQLGRWQAAIDGNLAARAIFAVYEQADEQALLWTGATYFNEAFNLASAGRPEEALPRYQQAAERYRRLAASSEPWIVDAAARYLADTVWNLSQLAEAKGDVAATLALRRERVELLRATSPGTQILAWALFDLAKSLGQDGEHGVAVRLLDEAIAIEDGAFAGHASPDLAWQRGYALEMAGRLAEAEPAYREAIRLFDTTAAAADTNLALLWGNVASLRERAGDNAALGEALAQQIEHVRRAAPGTLQLADLLQKRSLVLSGLGDAQGAAALAGEDVALRRQLQPNTPELGYALDNLGRQYLTLNDGARALPLFAEAIELGQEADAAWLQTFIGARVNLGIAHFLTGDYEQAIAAYDAALREIDRAESTDKLTTAITLGNLADLAHRIGYFAQAEQASLRQIAILREIRPGSLELARALYLLSFNNYRLARYEEGLALLRESRPLFLANSGPNDPEYLETFRQEGWYLEGAGRRTEALSVLEDGLARMAAAQGRETVDYGNMLSGHAWVLRKTGRLVESEREFRTALDIIERKLGPTDVFTTSAYINLSILTQLNGKNREAIGLAMKALANIQRDPRTTMDEQRWTFETLSLAFRDLGDTRRAILFAKQAINVQQQLRASNKAFSEEKMEGFRKEWRRLYENLADMLIAEGRLSEAQAVLAMEKESELVDFIQRDATADLRDSRAQLTAGEEATKLDLAALLEKPIAAASAYAELAAKKSAGTLAAAEEERLSALEASLDDAYSGFMDDVDAFLAAAEEEDDAVRQEVEAINLDYTADAQEELRALGGRAVMLQVASLGEATHLFLTVPDASVHREVKIERAALSRLVFEALSAIESRDPAAKAKLKALYDVLVAPVADDLRDSGADTVMLNLQGFLRYVPFAALYDGEHYLVEDYALSVYTPAAKTRFEAAERAPEKSAGFGVTASHPGFSPLPGVGREIEAIFGGQGADGALKGTASLDAAFTREAFQTALRARPEIVHIASHFKLVPGRETDSFLLLGDGSPLSLSDIRKGRGFRFGGVDLLTLSACETARGGDGEGDEVESFGALAQMNGASSVMATLWPVADEATAQLMRSFYRHMVEGGMDKAAALRAAQLEQIRGGAAAAKDERGAAPLKAATTGAAADPAHPYFWSPFILMGNWL